MNRGLRVISFDSFEHGGDKIYRKLYLAVLIIAITLVSTNAIYATGEDQNSSYNNSSNLTPSSQTQSNNEQSSDNSSIKENYTVQQIVDTAGEVKAYTEVTKTLPTYITINGKLVNQAQFLNLITAATLQLSSNNTTNIFLKSATTQGSGTETLITGFLSKSDYLTLAQLIKDYIETNKTAPANMNTSFGTINFQSEIYAYSRILSHYKTNGLLPDLITVKAWSAANIPILNEYFTVQQIINTAAEVKSYTEATKTLPTYITINGKLVNQAQFLHLITTATLQLSNNNNTVISLESTLTPGSGSESMNPGTLSKSEYLTLAQQIKSYIEDTHQTPSSCLTSLGYINYQSVIYSYSRILSQYKTNTLIPDFVTVKPWSAVNIPILDSFYSFTVQQIINTAAEVKSYTEATKTLPISINVAGTPVNQAQFLHLLTTATLQLSNNKTSNIALKSAITQGTGTEVLTPGTLPQTDYLTLAQQTKNYVETNKTAPTTMNTILGTINFQSEIYAYSRILSQYKNNNLLPDFITVKAWSTTNIPIVDNSYSFTVQQIVNTAIEVKSYTESIKSLPISINVAGTPVNQAQFLQLLTTATLQLSNNNSALIVLKYATTPSSTGTETLSSGILSQTEYLTLAQQTKNYVETNKTAPTTMNTRLGTINFQSEIYTYSRILYENSVHSNLPPQIILKPWAVANIPVIDDYFTVKEICVVAGDVKRYTEANKAMPIYITILGIKVNQSQFLYLLTQATLQINKGDTTSIIYVLQNTAAPVTGSENMANAGTLQKAEYLALAEQIKNYIIANNVSPSSCNSSLGYVNYQSIIDAYSQILDYYQTNQTLPASVSVKKWSEFSYCIPVGYEQYVVPTANCQSDNAQIIALSNSITAGATTPYDKAVRIFNWVRDNIGYSFYYNTKYGAVGTLNAKTGNCVDTTHLLIALSRAAGLPAIYKHGTCRFSSGTYGHVWANIYVNGVWYTCDATSTRNSFGSIVNWNTATYILKGTYTGLPF